MPLDLDLFYKASQFAARCHGEQKYPGQNFPYFLHLSQVQMEVQAAYLVMQDFNIDLATVCALLHDTIEDTKAEYDDLKKDFGKAIADGVQALTKDISLPKEEQMQDSLERILQQPHEVAIVKMADRCANLQAPPSYWSTEKRRYYQGEAKKIWKFLHKSNGYIAERLAHRTKYYEKFISK